ncbi:MAG: ATP synthase subunit I [Gammaproteobacteria bacterium]|nr:ATP synthase subunit I [Gammaproteobacteria bacterium]
MEIRAKAYRIVAAQFVVVAVISAGLLFFSSSKSAWSGLAGGLIAALGSLSSVLVLFPRQGRSAIGFVGALYAGEALKMILTVVLFWVAIALLGAAVLPLLLTFIATLMVYWLALLPKFVNRPH